MTKGPIYKTLVKFALPVILALFLQSLYGAVDLIVVGQFGTTADVSGVSSGSQLMHTITNTINGLAMGVTVLVGQKIGERKPEEAGEAVGTAIVLFALICAALTALTVPSAGKLASLMKAPQEAFAETSSYIRICCSGLVFIAAYNVLGGIFRGIGDSITPLITVSISCVLNIFCDLLFVAVFHLGAKGAALATILSQAVSVATSLLLIRRKKLPISFSKQSVRLDSGIAGKEIKLGIPIALQDLLVGISFLVIQTVVNRKGLVASAGIGVGEKVCAFIMLIPAAFAQSMTAFVAQNVGADQPLRCEKALKYGILTSICFGVIMFYLTFFHGNIFASVFDGDAEVVAAAHSYLKAYAIDCMLTPIMFCMVGFFNGYGKTAFVMFQGISSAFLIRVPLAILFGRLPESTLFLIGLSTPASTFIQIFMCLFMYFHIKKQGTQGR